MELTRTVPLGLSLLLSSIAIAQTRTEANIGLALQAAPNLRPFGISCGPFSCLPDQGFVFAGTRAQITAHGFPGTRYFIAISAARNGCRPIAGIANSLVLTQPLRIIAIGRIPQVLPLPPWPPRECPQGLATIGLNIPAGLPLGMQLLIQSLAESQFSPRGPVFLAFSSAIQVTVR